MTADEFRAIALGMPDAVEREHHRHPDFRVGNRIFATLAPDDETGVVNLTPEDQERFVAKHPSIFTPVTGAWGRRGYTRVVLAAARKRVVTTAIRAAWGSVATGSMAEKLPKTSAKRSVR